MTIQNSKVKKLLSRGLVAWVLSFAIAVLIFVLARPVFAGLIERETLLSTFLSSQNVVVGIQQDENRNPHVYYDFNGSQTVITKEDIPHADPVTDGKYIAWMSLVGQYWQIFFHHIPTDLTIQLTQNNGNNVNPKIANGKVIWEGQVDGVWQIFLYDGGQIKQLSRGDQPSINSDLEGDYIVYSAKVNIGKWKSFAYDISKKEQMSLTPGSFAKKSILKNGHAYWDDFDGNRKSVMEYNLGSRSRKNLSRTDALSAYGVTIEEGKIKWFEIIPDPPEPEEDRLVVAGASEDSPPSEEEQLDAESPLETAEVDLPPIQEIPEEKSETPALVSEEEVAEELGAEPAPEAEEPAEVITEENPAPSVIPEPQPEPAETVLEPAPEPAPAAPVPEPASETEPEE